MSYSDCNFCEYSNTWTYKIHGLGLLPACRLKKIVCISLFSYFFLLWSLNSSIQDHKIISLVLCQECSTAVSWTPETWECSPSPAHSAFGFSWQLKIFPLNGPAHRGKHTSIWCLIIFRPQHMFTAPSNATVHSWWWTYTVGTSPLQKSLGKVSYRQGVSELQLTQQTGNNS